MPDRTDSDLPEIVGREPRQGIGIHGVIAERLLVLT
jgi:hypothetical protein